jgi:hypothetical protein
MFCGGESHWEELHWCPMCKYSGCDWCCGCPGCHENSRGGWSPEGKQVNHDGIRERPYRE